MQRPFFIAGSLALSLTLWMGSAFAASEAEIEETAKALKEGDATLTYEQARELADLAAKDIEGHTVRELNPAERGLGLGRPEGIGEYPGGPMPEMTPQEKALMEEAKELEKKLGAEGKSPEQIHEAIERELGERFRASAEERMKEHPEMKEGPLPKEEMERYMKEHPDMKEQMEKYREGREGMEKEMERYREMEQREVYREPTVVERPTYDAPPMKEHGGY